MGKKRTELIFSALCLTLCAVLAVGTIIFGTSEAGANERLSAKPELLTADGKINDGFLSDAAGYYNDHFFLRQELITAESRLNAAVFGVSAREDVILGKHGWLYYADTLPDYAGTERMTDDEINAAANNLALMSEYCDSVGARLQFAVAPNKNSLYPMHMPNVGGVQLTHDAVRLAAALSERGVAYADLFSVFRSEDETLYFAHDSHWNSKGAALAADTVNSVFGRDSAYYEGDFSHSETHEGDLFEMLYPAGTDLEQNPVYGGELSYEAQGGSVRPDSITINTTGAGEGTLLCFRDSFGNLLYPYLADSFESARFSRAVSYDLTLAEALGADCVLIELVERNLSYLLTYVPVMPAPKRDVEVPASTGSCEVSTAGTSLAGCVLAKAEFSAPDGTENVYIRTSGGVYEAFITRTGAAAYVPENEDILGILLLADGEMTAWNC